MDQRASGEPARKKRRPKKTAAEGTDGAAEQQATAGGEQAGPAADDERDGDTPLPVGMQGNVLVFGFVLCAWSVEFGRETIYNDQGKVEKQTVGPMFALHPAGPQFRWYTVNNLRKSFSHPRRCLEHLAQCLDDKLRMGGAPQKQAKTMDAWGLFAVRDDSVCAFLRAHLRPAFAETLDKTVAVLKQRRKKELVNAYLVDMLEQPPAERAQAPEALDGPRVVSVSRQTEWAHRVTPAAPPSYIEPKKRTGKYLGASLGASYPAVWQQSAAGTWDKLAHSPSKKKARPTRDLDVTSPFMSRDEREDEERQRQREGRLGPGSARKQKLEQRRDLDVERVCVCVCV